MTPVANADRTDRLARAVGLLLLGLATLGLVWNAARFTAYAWAAVRYPYALDYGEGPVVGQTKLLMAGDSIYHAIDHGPFTIANYPPVYHLVSGAVDRLVHDTLAAGRLVSVASTLLTAVLIGTWIWVAAGARCDSLARSLASLAGGLLFLSVLYVYIWAPLMRVDMLALLFSIAGALAFATGGRRPRIVAGAALLLLAVYTKQTAIAGAAACFLGALIVRPAIALRLAGVMGVAGLGAFAALNWLTGGAFYFDLVTANAGQYRWRNAIPYFSDLAGRYPIDLAIAAVAAAVLLRTARPRPPDSAPGWSRVVLGAYLPAALLVSFTIGKTGAHVNYLVELMAVVSAGVGVAVAEPFVALTRPEPRRERRGRLLATVALPILLLWRVGALYNGPEQDWADLPSQLPRAEVEPLVTLIQLANGPVLSQDMTLLALAGKPIEFQPFEMTLLARQRKWDQTEFVEQLRSRRFQLIVLEFNVDSNPAAGAPFFTRDMIAAIQGNYQLAAVKDHYTVYTPRAPSAPDT